jgi:hypothetical protein
MPGHGAQQLRQLGDVGRDPASLVTASDNERRRGRRPSYAATNRAERRRRLGRTPCTPSGGRAQPEPFHRAASPARAVHCGCTTSTRNRRAPPGSHGRGCGPASPPRMFLCCAHGARGGGAVSSPLSHSSSASRFTAGAESPVPNPLSDVGVRIRPFLDR